MYQLRGQALWLVDTELTEILSLSDIENRWLVTHLKINQFSSDTSAYYYVSQIYQKQNQTRKQSRSEAKPLLAFFFFLGGCGSDLLHWSFLGVVPCSIASWKAFIHMLHIVNTRWLWTCLCVPSYGFMGRWRQISVIGAVVRTGLKPLPNNISDSKKVENTLILWINKGCGY